MASAGTVTLNLDANSVKLMRELQRSQRATERTAKKMRGSMVRAFKAIRSSVLSAGAAMGVFAAIRGFGRITGEIDKMGKLVDRLGGSTEAFSELQFAAERTGVRFETLTMGLQRMSRRVAEAAVGTGEAQGALKELGISAKALATLTIDQQFERIADAMHQVTDAGAKTRLAMKLFDSEGVALLQTMKGGAGAIRELRAEAQQLGFSLSREQVAAATKAQDAMTRLDFAARGFGQTLTLAVIPAITSLIEALNYQFIDDRARDIANAMDTIRKDLEFYSHDAAMVETLTNRFMALAQELEELKNGKIRQEFDALGEILVTTAKKGVTPYEAALRTLVTGMESAEARADKLRFALKLFGDELNPDQVRAVNAEISKILNSGIEEIDVSKINALKKPIDTLEKYYKRKAAEMVASTRTPVEQFHRDMRSLLANPYIDEETMQRQVQVLVKTLHSGLAAMAKDTSDFQKRMDAMSEQAARNMQDAFADFLFDPFEDGLKGMLRSFVDTLRRMVANQLALQVFSMLGGTKLGGFMGLGGKAVGGPVSAGTPYMVGERGPELFMPGASGTIIPNNRLTSGGNVFNFTNNVTSNGNMDAETLMPILEENNLKVKSEFLSELNRGSYD